MGEGGVRERGEREGEDELYGYIGVADGELGEGYG